MSDPIHISLTSVPPSVNSIWRKSKTGMFRSQKYNAWHNQSLCEVMASKKKFKRVEGPYQLSIIIDRKTRGDIDNRIKCASDFLQACGAIKDDKYAESVSISKGDIEGIIMSVFPA